VRRTGARLCLLLALTASGAISSSAAFAQIPGLPAIAKPDAAVAPAAVGPKESLDQQRERLKTQLEQSRAQRQRLASDPASLGAPPDMTPDDLAAARNALGQLVVALEGQLRILDELQETRAQRQEAEQVGSEPQALGGGPPYSILLVDDLQERVDSIKTTIGALTAQQVIAEREGERVRREAQRSEATLRRAREAVSAGRGDEDPLRRWQVQLAEWSAAAAAASIALFGRGADLIGEQMALEREQLKLAERQLQIASRNIRFTDEDLAQVRRAETEQVARIRRLSAGAAERAARQDAELLAATDALKRLEADSQASAEALAVARARLRAAQAAAESVRFEINALNSLVIAAETKMDLYTQRYQALNDGDAQRRRDAIVRLREAGDRFKPWRDFAQSQLQLLRAAQRESAARSDSQDVPRQVQAYESAIAESIRQRVGYAQRLLDAAERGDRTVRRWLSDIDTAQDSRPIGERLADVWAIGSDWAKRIWNFELFAVEDTIDVGGQKITTSRGVTIGKSVGALLLFVLGYWLAARLARYFERVLIARFAMAPAQARTVRRWGLALWAFVLLALTLNLARIPLTVFAFLGGALAIGVGFGTQTIIKNFISGLIVLMERQVQVGDIVDVDGVTGTVTEVNLRSSTVLGFDGVEAMIPNSSLLENKVTNWTHSDNRVRRVVKIGVAYGSPVRKVSDLLLECMQRHGQVLEDPEPRVLFDDFGDSALVFSMQFWVEMKPSVSSLVIMSDLRFMVHRALEEAGIAVPFPQRDVHLDATRPLRVEVLSGPATSSG